MCYRWGNRDTEGQSALALRAAARKDMGGKAVAILVCIQGFACSDYLGMALM